MAKCIDGDCFCSEKCEPILYGLENEPYDISECDETHIGEQCAECGDLIIIECDDFDDRVSMLDYISGEFSRESQEYRNYFDVTYDNADDEEQKILALAEHLAVDPSEIHAAVNDEFEYGSECYLVLTDDEADTRWDDSLDQYIDDCILCELPEAYQSYFDSEKWKRDARYDGRGHSLATYDGAEWDARDFYIYRTN